MEDSSRKATEWMDREVVDIDGHKIGSVGDMYYDSATGKPEWVLIKTGLFGTKKTFIPGGEVSEKGNKLIFPYAKEVVGGAPRVEHEEELTEAQERGLYSYYGLDYLEPTAGDQTSQSGAAGREEPSVRPVPRPCDLVRLGGQWKDQPLGFMVVTKEEISCEDEPAAEEHDGSPTG